MIKSTFPVNKANPLKIPLDIPIIGFLGGEGGKEINNSIKKDYPDNKVLHMGNYFDNLVKNSNPFYAVAVQSRLPSGVNLSTQANLETAMRIGSMDFKGTYEDTGLVLRNGGNPNIYLADYLMKQIKERGKKRMPVMIPLKGLKLEKDSNSSYGLAFKLKDDAELISAPILNRDGKFNSEDIDEKTGLPKKFSSLGNRFLYTSDLGLSRLLLDWDLDLDSDWVNLADSDSYGRVVLTSIDKSGSQDFLAQKLTNLNAQRDAQIEKMNKNYQEEKRILKEK